MTSTFRSAKLRQSFNRLDRMHETDLSKTQWVYLRHPSGRIHRINAGERVVIAILIEWGWKKVSSRSI